METETATATPVLTLAWKRFAQLDASSRRRTSLYRSVRRWVLVLCVLATLLAILSQLFPRAGSGIPAPSFMTGICAAIGVCQALGFIIRILLVATPILASLLALIATWGFSKGDWLVTRAGAEKILKEIYFYRTILQKKNARRAYLEKSLNEILRQVSNATNREYVDKRYRGRIPPNYSAGDPSSDAGFNDLTGEEYFRYRLDTQLAWHTRKVNQYRAERFRLQLYILLFGAAGAILAAFDSSTIWVALTASLTAAFVGWQEIRNLDAIIKNYSKVVIELTLLHDHWLNLEAEQRTDDEFYRMVRSCEEILWTQNAEYIKSMQETLEKFGLDEEASLIDRIVQEAVESAERSQLSLRESVVEFTKDISLEAEEIIDETFKSALGSLAEEAASEIVMKELAAMRKAAEEAGQHADPSDDIALPKMSAPEKAEQVAFTAYHPKEGKVQVWHTLLVYVHTLSAFRNVRQDVTRFKDQIKAPKEVTHTSTTLLSRGTEITIVPFCEGVTFNPERFPIKWIEDYQRVEFRFSADQSLLDDAAKGRIDIFVGPLIVGSLKFAMLFNNSPEASTPDHEEHSEMYRKDAIFVSYSHRDAEIVEAFKSVHQATGHDVLIDIDNLRAGQEWNPELMRMIDRADIFQLFWSQNSSQSAYCQQEWQYALEKKKEGFIRPVYWQLPLPEPPEELSKFHFEYVKLPR